MAGQPKNKVTRAEQGKRRRGNTPYLLKNLKQATVLLHKRTLFAQIAKLGDAHAATSAPSTASAAPTTQAKQTGKPTIMAPSMVKNTPVSVKTPTPQKRMPQTQHKGG